MSGPWYYLLLHRDNKGQQPQISSVDFKAAVAVQQEGKQPLDGRTPAAESVLTRFSPMVDFVGVKYCFALSAALLHF